MDVLFSTRDELEQIAASLRRYHRLPFVSSTIPGAVVESVLASVRNMRRIGGYDFTDVYDKERRFGFQVKSSMKSSPLTWQRAKVPNSGRLREASKEFASAAQELGEKILTYINNHMIKDFDEYGIDSIGYARLVIDKNKAFYFEKRLIDREHPILFDPKEFTWEWNKQREAAKEQQGSLSAFKNGERWFSWHSENQLHFNNEKDAWWPPEGDPHRIDFEFSSNKMSFEAFAKLLEATGAEIDSAADDTTLDTSEEEAET